MTDVKTNTMNSSHPEGGAGFLVQVDFGEDSAGCLLNIKNAATVGRLLLVHSVTHFTGCCPLWSTQT